MQDGKTRYKGNGSSHMRDDGKRRRCGCCIEGGEVVVVPFVDFVFNFIHFIKTEKRKLDVEGWREVLWQRGVVFGVRRRSEGEQGMHEIGKSDLLLALLLLYDVDEAAIDVPIGLIVGDDLFFLPSNNFFPSIAFALDFLQPGGSFGVIQNLGDVEGGQVVHEGWRGEKRDAVGHRCWGQHGHTRVVLM